jgi:hypothetical protein
LPLPREVTILRVVPRRIEVDIHVPVPVALETDPPVEETAP